MFKYILIGLMFLGTLSNIALIDKEREPVTKGQAILGVVLNSIFIYGLLNWI